MEPSTRLQENISVMVDNELPACEVELTLAALAEPEGREAWHLYHLIRDTLRAAAAVPELSPGFAERLAERLADEELPGRPADALPREQSGDSASPAAVTLP
jgi:sigma-E factor negative regulatory protein RseA